MVREAEIGEIVGIGVCRVVIYVGGLTTLDREVVVEGKADAAPTTAAD